MQITARWIFYVFSRSSWWARRRMVPDGTADADASWGEHGLVSWIKNMNQQTMIWFGGSKLISCYLIDWILYINQHLIICTHFIRVFFWFSSFITIFDSYCLFLTKIGLWKFNVIIFWLAFYMISELVLGSLKFFTGFIIDDKWN